MKLTSSVTAAFTLCFTCFSLQARQDLLELVPENSWLIMEVQDLKGFQKDMEESPFQKMWKESISKYFNTTFWLEWAETAKKGEWSEEDREVWDTLKEFEEQIKPLKEKFDGQILFSLGGDMKEMALQALEGDGKGGLLPEVFLLAQTTASTDDLEDFFKWLEEKNEEVGDEPDRPLFIRDEIEGTPVYFIDSYETTITYNASASKDADDLLPDADSNLDVKVERSEEDPQPEKRIGVFVSKGVLGVCLGQEKVVDLLQTLEEGEQPENILENYENSFEDVGRGDFNLFLNGEQLADLMGVFRNHEKAKFPENPMKVTSQGLLDAFQLEGFQSLALSSDVTPEGMDLNTALYLKHRKGLWAFLDLYKGDAKLPPFVPDDVMASSSAGYDMGRFWETVEVILLNISPVMKGMVDFQLQVLNQTHKINIREDVLTNFGDQIATFAWMPNIDKDQDLDETFETMAGRDFYAVSLKDGERFDRSVQVVLGTMMKDALKTREHKGVEVHFVPLFGNTYISYSVTQNWLLFSIGPPSDINKVVEGLQEPPTDQLWTQPEIEAALNEAPSGVVQWDYADLEEIPDFMTELMNALMKEEFEKPFFAEKLPALPYFILAWTKDDKEKIISKASIFPKDK